MSRENEVKLTDTCYSDVYKTNCTAQTTGQQASYIYLKDARELPDGRVLMLSTIEPGKNIALLANVLLASVSVCFPLKRPTVDHMPTALMTLFERDTSQSCRLFQKCRC